MSRNYYSNASRSKSKRVLETCSTEQTENSHRDYDWLKTKKKVQEATTRGVVVVVVIKITNVVNQYLLEVIAITKKRSVGAKFIAVIPNNLFEQRVKWNLCPPIGV